MPTRTAQQSPWRRWAARHGWVVDALIACCLLLIGLGSTARAAPGRPWVWLITLGLVAPLIWRRRHPVAVFAVVATVALAQWALGLRLSADLALLVALYTVAAGQPRGRAVAAAAVLELGALLAAIRFAPAGDTLTSLVFLSGLVAAAFFIGTTVQTRRAYLGALVDRAARAERERDQQASLAATAERTRIARELHDIVAHSLTVVVTLAEAAAAASTTDPPAARQAMGQVATTGREALVEMRRLLGVLRTDPGTPGGTDPAAGPEGLAPAPGLDRLDQLVAHGRAAGLPVRLTISGRPRPLASTVDATAYRVAQESLTNVLKHAVEPSRVHVVLRWSEDDLVLEISDDGRRARVAPAGGGHGLPGMRERLALFGGELSAGPDPSGGWIVRAVLPCSGGGP